MSNEIVLTLRARKEAILRYTDGHWERGDDLLCYSVTDGRERLRTNDIGAVYEFIRKALAQD